MGKCDIILSQYFEDDCRYADLINGFVFEGRQVVDEKDIIDRNPVITGFLGKVKGCIPIQKYRCGQENCFRHEFYSSRSGTPIPGRHYKRGPF